MGGGNSKEEIKTKITNKISTKISSTVNNTTENLNKSLTDISQSVTNNIVSASVASASAVTAVDQKTKAGNVVIGGTGNVTKLGNRAKVSSETLALQSLFTNTSAVAELGAKVSQEVLNTIKNNTALKNEVQTAVSAAASNSSQTGGVGDMVNAAMNMLATLTGGGNKEKKSDTEIETIISTEMTNIINNRTVNMTDVANKIASSVNTNISSNLSSSCSAIASAKQQIEIGDITMYGAGNKFEAENELTLTAVNKCIQELKMGTSAMSAVIGEAAFKAISDTSNVTEIKNSAKTESSSSSSNKQEDAFAAMLATIMGALPLIIVLVIVCGGIGYFIYSQNKDKLENIGDMDGGAFLFNSEFNNAFTSSLDTRFF
jgi:hypothetical protein